jgi:hypothetical protein
MTTSFVAVFVLLRVHSCSLGHSQCLRQKDAAWLRIHVRCQVLCRENEEEGFISLSTIITNAKVRDHALQSLVRARNSACQLAKR